MAFITVSRGEVALGRPSNWGDQPLYSEQEYEADGEPRAQSQGDYGHPPPQDKGPPKKAAGKEGAKAKPQAKNEPKAPAVPAPAPNADGANDGATATTPTTNDGGTQPADSSEDKYLSL